MRKATSGTESKMARGGAAAKMGRQLRLTKVDMGLGQNVSRNIIRINREGWSRALSNS